MAADEREPAPPDATNGAGSSNAGDIVRKDGPAVQAPPTAMELAQSYRARGWKPIRINRGEKGPKTKHWQKVEFPDAEFAGPVKWNVGVQLGAVSGGLVDIDFDWPRAARIGDLVFGFAPAFGRVNNRASHRLVRVTDGGKVPTKKYSVPGRTKQQKGMVLELRGCGMQTVFPGSVHPSGERIAWTDGQPPAEIPSLPFSELQRLADATVVLTVAAAFWPVQGNRDTFSMAVAGVLLRMQFAPELVDEWVVTAAGMAGDEEAEKRRKAVATKAKLDAGDETTGLPTMLELLATDEEGVRTLLKKAAGFKSTPAASGAGEMFARFEGKGDDGKDLPLELRFRMRLAQLGVRLEYDEFQDRTMIYGLPGFGPHLDDAALVRLRFALDPKAKRPIGKDLLDDLCVNEARNNRRHPVREFLAEVQPTWDGTSRLDTWLIEYLGAPDTPYVRAVSRIFLIAAVRRVRRPGCKFDELVVLEGDQGSGRSTLLKRLAVNEDWFTDDFPLNADGKRIIEMTAGKWIIECGELKGMRRNDVEALKAMLSRQSDRARMAYGRKTAEVPRQWVAAGTTNTRKYLRDQTGNRRFWGVQCGKVDLKRFTMDLVRQLWAEAATEEAKGDPRAIRLDPALYDAAAEVQRERTADDPLLHVLVDALEGREHVRIPTDDVWAVLGAADPAKRTQELNERVGEIMQRLGYVNARRRLDGEPRYHYVHGTGVELLRVRVGQRGEFLGWAGENVPPGHF